MTEEQQAREARAQAHALSVMPREHMGWWAIKNAHLKGGEEERAAEEEIHVAQDQFARLKAMVADHPATMKQAADKIEALAEKLRVLTEKLSLMRAALLMIATPVRADGTYNRSREACELLAREALSEARMQD